METSLNWLTRVNRFNLVFNVREALSASVFTKKDTDIVALNCNAKRHVP
jgi:hypothetical protein